MGVSKPPLNLLELLNVSTSLGANEIYTSPSRYCEPYSKLIGIITCDGSSQVDGLALEFSNDDSEFYRTFTATMNGSRAPLAVFNYEATGPVWSDNTLMESSFAMVPWDSAADNFVYFGYSQKFSGLAITVDTAGTNDAVLSYEYWDGTVWKDLSGVLDGTTGFTANGSLTFTIPEDWVRNVVNETLGFFIRIGTAEVTSYTSTTTLSNVTMISAEFDVFVEETLGSYVRVIFENGTVEQDVKIILNGRRV